MEDRSILNLVILALVIVATLLGPLVERWRRRRAQERGRKVEGPEPAEPKLPYEDLVDQVFGPYMERRRREWEDRRAEKAAAEEAPAQAVEVEVIEEPPRRAPEAVIRRIEAVEERPAQLVAIQQMKVAGLGVTQAATEVSRAAAGPSLEERLFANPRLGPAAKLVLASEILGRPVAFRPRRGIPVGS